MYRALWAVAVLAAVALGTAVFSGVVNHSDARAQSAKLSAVTRQESVDQREIARLQAEMRGLSTTR